MKKKIFYYTQIFYLDCALEYIKLASEEYSISLYIEVTPEALHANIFDLNTDLSNYEAVVSFNEVKYDWKIELFSSYFEKCDSVFFVIFPHQKSLSIDSIIRAVSLQSIIKEAKYDYIHLEDISLRILGLIPYFFLNSKKIILNVHDPKPHSGEYLFKKEVCKKVFYHVCKKYICFSTYSSEILRKQFKDNSVEIHKINLLPYTYYRNFIRKDNESSEKKISFVGRVSKYKGIELFINSIRLLGNEFPNEKYCIAGKQIAGYDPGFADLVKKNVQIINQHLSNEELVEIITNSKLIVCPYLDATQSGVIMTAYSLGCPVLVTPVGGLPEYVNNYLTGVIAEEVSAEGVAKAIKAFLLNGLQGTNIDFQMNNLIEENIEQIRLIYKNRA